MYEQSFADNLRINTFLSRRHGLLYISTPKVACTSLKWWLASIEGCTEALRAVVTESDESDPDLTIHDNFHKVAPHVAGLDLEHLSEALTSDAYFRFAVVRNPYQRIFSAWQSKLLLREPLQIGPYITSEFFHHPIERRQDIAAAFEGFLRHLASNEEGPSVWDHHWMPQATLLRPDLINYSKLTKIENAAELSKALGEWLGANAPDPFALGRMNESLIPYLPAFISGRSEKLIRALYAEDFDVFGYDRKPPSSAETFSTEQLDVAIKAIKLIRGRHERLGQRAAQIKMLKQTAAERKGQIADFIAEVNDRDQRLVAANDQLVEVIAQAASDLRQSRGETQDREKKLVVAEQELRSLVVEVNDRDQRLVVANDRLVEAIAQAASDLRRSRGETQDREKKLVMAEQELRRLVAEINDRDQRLVAVNDQLAEVIAQAASDLRRSRGETQNREKRLVVVDQELRHLIAEVNDRDHQLTNAMQVLSSIKEEVAERDQRVMTLERRLHEIEMSTTWRISAPLRRLFSRLTSLVAPPKKVA
jgi:Sulfotransferase family